MQEVTHRLKNFEFIVVVDGECNKLLFQHLQFSLSVQVLRWHSLWTCMKTLIVSWCFLSSRRDA